jgi:hypothetical protein
VFLFCLTLRASKGKSVSSLISVSVTGQGIVFERDAHRAALPNEQLDAKGVEEFKKLNYELQGTVGYQHFLDGVMAGVCLLMGPPPMRGEIPAEVSDAIAAITEPSAVIETDPPVPVPVPAAAEEPAASVSTESTTSTKDGSEAAA